MNYETVWSAEVKKWMELETEAKREMALAARKKRAARKCKDNAALMTVSGPCELWVTEFKEWETEYESANASVGNNR